MASANIPLDEAERLNALIALDILDTPPDPRFDCLVRLAADLYDVPTAMISLVDRDRQWFKARHGLDTTETPRDHAFCAHAILDPSEVFIVEDASRDARFADNPLVTAAQGIRFYAGAPIRGAAGHPLGTICLLDTEPRTLDESGRRRLQDLASTVAALLDLHHTTLALRRAATHDSLTGLANRALFDHRLEQAIATAANGRSCALLLIDLDHFKEVNDRHGHQAGDALLREVARRLQSAVRGSDLLARTGGDEFALLMLDPADTASVEHVAARIGATLSAPWKLDDQIVTPSATIGIALCPHDELTMSQLVRAADLALYAGKHQGRRCAVFAHDCKPAPTRTPASVQA